MQPAESNVTILPPKNAEDEKRVHKEISSLILNDIGYKEGIKKIKRLSGGVTNVLYKVKFESGKVVLVRVNGIGTENIINRNHEFRNMQVIFSLFRKGKVWGRFFNGCVYDFVKGKPLLPDDIVLHAKGIAKHLAVFHSTVNLDHVKLKKPVFWKSIERWCKQVQNISFSDVKKQEFLDKINVKGRIFPEIEIFRDITKDWEVRVCHNDLLGLNILHTGDKEFPYYFIDLEYAGYNYIAFDIGNHFCEYLGLEASDTSKYPTEEQQHFFVREYLRQRKRDDPSDLEVRQLTAMANVGALMSCVFWGIWGIYQSSVSCIEFNYLEYANLRFGMYFEFKKKTLEEYYKICESVEKKLS